MNFLIVDNEKIICDGMKRALDSTGLFQVYVAYDGLEALRIIKEKDINAMILDIAMPNMNGVDLMKELRNLELKPITVVVSGYDQFEYAKESLSYGAIDYLLKPVDAEDVIEIGERIQKLLDQQENKKQEVERLRRFVIDHKETIKQKAIYDVLHGAVSPERLLDISDFYGFDLPGDYCCVAVVNVDKCHAAMNELQFQIALKMVEDKITASLLPDEGIQIFNLENAKYVLIFNSEETFSKGYPQDILNGLIDELNDVADVNCYIGKGDAVEKRDISQSYRNAQTVLDYRSMFGAGFVYSIEDYRQDNHVLKLEQLLRELESEMRLMQYDVAQAKIGALFTYIRENYKSIDHSEIRFFSAKCALLFSMLLIENGYDTNGISYDNFLSPVKAVTNESMLAVERQILTIFKQTVQHISSGYVERHKKLAALVLQHINQNFADCDLSVAALSTVFSYSPNYLGNIFKKEYGLTINDFLNKCRIDKAKKLLDETDLKIYEVAFQVGYKDQHYFSKQFKKYETISPTEYKDV